MLTYATGKMRYFVGAVLALLLVGIVVAIAANRPSMEIALGQAVTGRAANAAALIRGADFDFVDHELRYAGGYGLGPAPAAARGAAFDFLDHELRYAGGYGLVPEPRVERGADFDFLDHELRYAGGYGFAPIADSSK
ncbi:MAG: hypothetical protein JXC32_09280 [Anaerolineae bacterium]|nr:hypothetical protein [Anaerolineae bacterium]